MPANYTLDIEAGLTQVLSDGGVTTSYTLELEAGLPQVLGDGGSKVLYGLGQIGQEAPGGWAYMLGDALGSARQLTDAAGAVILAHDFEPFGGAMASAGHGSTAFEFTGEQQDPSGLIYLRARYHDSSAGRFMTRDPFPGLPALPATLPPHPHGPNNPVNLVDPRSPIAPLFVAAVVSGVTAEISGAKTALGSLSGLALVACYPVL